MFKKGKKIVPPALSLAATSHVAKMQIMSLLQEHPARVLGFLKNMGEGPEHAGGKLCASPTPCLPPLPLSISNFQPFQTTVLLVHNLIILNICIYSWNHHQY